PVLRPGGVERGCHDLLVARRGAHTRGVVAPPGGGQRSRLLHMKAEEYGRHDALGLADLVRRGEVSATEVCDAAIARIETLNPTLNAVISRRFDQARAEARSVTPEPDRPFAGVPVLLKGLVQSHCDLPSAEGSRFLVDHRPGVTSELASRMEAAGAI